jgi:predicted Zn finger-like uncharacterized protein
VQHAMHVQCESCATEYEFDDALVSGRGTTVKCSNCGHQFKVRKSGTAADQWLVTTADGSTFVYNSLRELQRAILTRQIDGSDLLERGGVAPRPIGQIAELAPFFDEKRRSPSILPHGEGPPPETIRSAPPVAELARLDPDRTAATPARLLEQHLAATRTPVPPPPTQSPISELAETFGGAPIRPRVLTEPDFPPVPPHRSLPDLDDENIPTRLADVPQSPQPSHASSGPRVASVELAPGVGERQEPTPVHFVEPPRPRVESVAAAPIQTAQSFVQTTMPIEVTSPLPPPMRRIEPDEWPDSGVPMRTRPRRSVGGMVVALVVLLAVGGMGAYYVRGRLAEKVAPTLDPKAEAFLAAGEKALGDGDLDRAKENFDKASVLAEKNARLLLGYARLATSRADLSWIRQLVAGESEVAALKSKTVELASLAVSAADAAAVVAPEDPAVVRTKIDGLRAQGQIDKARVLVPKVVSQGNQAESAYVLATLDMAGPDPVWSTVLQRLRLAASIEGASGRARAALIVALVRSGDSDGARGEVSRLETGSASHPLLVPLRAYSDRSKAAPPVSAADDGGAAAGVDVSSLKALSGGGATDPRVLVSQAEIARGHGKLDVAKRLYELALQKSPTDSEALTGLAQVAHAQRDTAAAKDAYRRALAQNSSYVPALVGLADVEWESGDRAAAQKSYREVVERFPESAYPARVKTRAEGGAPTAAPSAPAPPTSAPTPAPISPEPTAAPSAPAPSPPPKPAEEPSP